MQVIPAINEKTFKEAARKIKLVEPFTEWVQLDIADGTFTKNILWHNPADLDGLQTSLKLEAHLMINDIEKEVDKWLVGPIKRIIFHLETAKDPYAVIEKCKKAGKEAGIAIAPDISWTQLMPFCGKVGLFQILAVKPGLAGQKFMEDSVDKIISLRENCPSAIIEVDGGVNKQIAKKVSEAGADIISAASYVFGSDDIGKAIVELKSV